MFLINWRNSKLCRIVTVLLLNFLISQTTFAQDQFHVQKGTHLYTPVEEVDAKRLDEKGTGSVDSRLPPNESADPPRILAEKHAGMTVARAGTEALPNPNDFWKESLEMFDLNLFISFCGIDATILWR